MNLLNNLFFRKSNFETKSRVSALMLFISIFTLGLSWVIFQPPFASVDEPAHASRAYTAVHGQLIFPINTNTAADAVDEITVPNWILPYAEPDSPYCFWSRIEITADCAKTDWSKDEPTKRPNQFAQYFPTFYFIAGLPSIWFHGQLAYYLMRFFGMLMVMVFFYMILREIRINISPKLIGLSLIAITPMNFLGAATLAPLALETLSITLLTILLFRISNSGFMGKADQYKFYVVLFTSLTARPSGIVWNVIVWSYFLLTRQLDIRNINKTNLGKNFTRVSLIIFIFASVNLYLHRPKVAYNLGTYKITIFNNLSFGVQSASEQFNNMIGIFGMDVYIPHIFYYISFGILSFFVYTNIFSKNITKIQKTFLALVSLLLLTLHMFADYFYKDIFAHIWIGRYTTPLLAFIIAICILNLRNELNIWIFAAYGIGINLLALWISYFRYSIGFTGGNCCGVLRRLENGFKWYPLGQGIGTLAALSTVIVTCAFGSYLLQKSLNESK